jgi:hypothetical protein
MKTAVVPAAGIGDSLLLQTIAHHLPNATLFTSHLQGMSDWFPYALFASGDLSGYDRIIVQYDNTKRAASLAQLRGKKEVYLLYPSYKASKHPPLHPRYDFAFNPKKTVLQNLLDALKKWFKIDPEPDNGLRPLPHLRPRAYPNRVILHPTSSCSEKNWDGYQKLAAAIEGLGFEPQFIASSDGLLTKTLSDLASIIYESGFFIGNDSGPAHLASNLQVPHLVVARELSIWRPDFSPGEVALLHPFFRKFSLFNKNWKKLITTRSVVKKFNHLVESLNYS